jgi:hypothetical protein
VPRPFPGIDYLVLLATHSNLVPAWEHEPFSPLKLSTNSSFQDEHIFIECLLCARDLVNSSFIAGCMTEWVH